MKSLLLAARSLAKSPGFTFVAVLTLALGIGMNTAMFGVVNDLILRPLPLPHAERLFRLDRTTSIDPHASHSLFNALELQRNSADFTDMAFYRYWGFAMAAPNHPAESLSALRVSGNFFHTLGVQPILGRDFTADDDQQGKNKVIILSYRVWQTHFAGDRGVIGRVIRLDGEPNEIIGVMPQRFGESNLFDYIQIYRPMGMSSEERTNRTTMDIYLIGRYHNGVSESEASSRFDALAARLAKDFPKENAASGLKAAPLDSSRISDLGRKIVFLLLCLSSFVLLIVCSNLANLLLARTISRSREFAIRGALGGSRWQLMRPIAAECALLALVGGIGGLAVYRATVGWMSWRFGNDVTPFNIPFDWRVLVFAIVGCLSTAFLFGLAPAWLVSRLNINKFLKSGARGSTGDRSHEWFRRILIVGQFCLALVLLTAASAFVVGVDRLVHQRSGWTADNLLSCKIGIPSNLYDSPEKIIAFLQTSQTKIGSMPGVADTAVSMGIPAFGFNGPRGYMVEGQPPPIAGHEPMAFYNSVSPEYFRVIGTKIIQGRGIEPTDTQKSPNVLVINESMARALFPKGDAIGHRLGVTGSGDADWGEIVGIAEDVRFLDPRETLVHYQVYRPYSKEPWGYVSFTVKMAPNFAAGGLIQQIRQTFATLAPDLPLQDLMPVPAAIDRNFRDFATIDQLLVAFALLGLFLAALGIYGVLARLVVQRAGEIGIRMALGAQIRDVVRLIVIAGLKMAVIGTVLGLLGSFGLGHILVNAIPGVITSNTPAIAFATALLLVIALLACWLPALKSARVDPLVALRDGN
jgi:predicted permease